MPNAALRLAPEPLTGVQKAAVLLMYLDREAAKALLRGLTDEEVQTIGTAIHELGEIDEDMVEQVVADFVDQLRIVALVPTNGPTFARDVLPGLLPEERRNRLSSALRRSGADDFEAFIRSRPPKAVASVLADEHSQVRAIALLRMGTENAARVLACFPPWDQADLAVRMAKAEHVAPELAEDIEAALRRALGGIEDPMPVGGVERTARILGRMAKGADVLGGVRAIEDALADDLQRRMVSWDDLQRLDGRAIQALLRVVERPDLVTALKGSTEAMRERFLTNMSQRAAADLREEIEISGPVRKALVRDAQDKIVAAARQLADEGTIYLDLGAPEEGA